MIMLEQRQKQVKTNKKNDQSPLSWLIIMNADLKKKQLQL